MRKKIESVSSCVATKAAAVLGVENVSEPQKSKDTCANCATLSEKLNL